MSDGPIFGKQRERLGQQRLEEFTRCHALLQAMAMCLVMSVMTVPQGDYSDEAIAAMLIDARDVREAADHWARMVEELAEHWRVQREEATA